MSAVFGQLRSFEVRYLLPFRRDVMAVADSSGQYLHQELLVGESEEAVVAQICELGAVPVSIRVMKSRSKLISPINRAYKMQFLKAVYFNCTAMSAAKALEAVIESDTSAARTQLNSSLAIIKSGGGFMEAIEAIGVFDESTLAILEAGERMGTIRQSIAAAIDYLENSGATNKLMWGIASVAAGEIFFAVTSLLGNRYVLLPNILGNMPENADPEKIEEIRTAVEYGIVFNDVMIWSTFAVMFMALAAFFAYFDKNKAFRKWMDDRVMAVPALSKTLLHTAVASSFKVAASLMKGGVHLPVAMAIATKSSRVPRVIDYWETASRRAESGDSVAGSLMQPLLDNSDRLLIGAHANRLQLAESLEVVAERRNEMAKRSAKHFGYLLFFAMLAYITVALLSSLYALWIQNSTMMSTLQG